jgi:hypothetical protein
VWLERLGKLKIPKISSGIKPTTFQLVAWYLNKLQYCVPHFTAISKVKSLVSVPPIEIKLFRSNQIISVLYYFHFKVYFFDTVGFQTGNQSGLITGVQPLLQHHKGIQTFLTPAIFTFHASSYFRTKHLK